jgi:hypothetical protein
MQFLVHSFMHSKEPTHGLRNTHPQPTLFHIHPTLRSLPHSHGNHRAVAASAARDCTHWRRRCVSVLSQDSGDVESLSHVLVRYSKWDPLRRSLLEVLLHDLLRLLREGVELLSAVHVPASLRASSENLTTLLLGGAVSGVRLSAWASPPDRDNGRLAVLPWGGKGGASEGKLNTDQERDSKHGSCYTHGQ